MADLKYSVSVETAKAQRDLAKLNTKVNGLSKGFKVAAASIAASVSAIGFGSLIKGVLDTSRQFEKYKVVLTTYLGSQQKANKAIEGLQKLANELPQDLNDVVQAFTIFTRTGVDASAKAMRNWSNIAAANGKSMTQLAEAVADSLTGEFERFKEFGIKVSKESGKYVARIGDQVVALGDTATEVTSAIEKLGETKFSGVAAANAGTLDLALSNLQGAVTETALAMAEELSPVVRDIAVDMASWLRANNDLAKSLGAGLATTIKAVADATKLLLENIRPLVTALTLMTSAKILHWAQQLLGVTGALSSGFGAFLLRVTGVTTAITLLSSLFAFLGTGIGAALGIIAALTVAYTFLKDETFQLGEITTSLSEIFSAVWETIKTGVSIAIMALTDAFQTLKTDTVALRAAFGETFQFIWAVIRSIGNAIIGLVNGMIQTIAGLPGAFVQVFKSVQKVINEALSNVGKSFKELWDYITSMGQDKIEFVWGGLSDTWREEMAKVANHAVDWETILGTDYIGKAGDAVAGYFEGLVRRNRAFQEDVAKLKQAAISNTVKLKEAEEKVTNEVKNTKEELEAATKEAERLKEVAQDIESAFASSEDLIASWAESSQAAQDAFNDLDLNPLAKEIKGIEREIDRGLKKKVKELKALLGKGGDDIAILIQIRQLEEAAERAKKTQAELAAKSYEHQRTFAYGWKKAFEDYADQAKNAASSAERIFAKTTQGIEDMIVGFAKTGKFEWKDFAASILEELLRTQIRILTADIFGGGTSAASNTASSVLGNTVQGAGQGIGAQQQGSGTSILGSIGNLASGAWNAVTGLFQGNSGPSGPQQPGILSGIGNVVGGAWDAVSNIGSSIASGIGSAVSAVGDFFGGFFANGGTLGAGKWGIAGENGPELITGPAGITPMGAGGSTNVTYNIQAVDAASFQALVARDPGFIHAVAMQGAKGTPGRR